MTDNNQKTEECEAVEKAIEKSVENAVVSTACTDECSQMCSLPSEILINIFEYLPVKALMRCRTVNKRWKQIIDDLASSDHVWLDYCKADFGSLYKDAMRKTKLTAGLMWYNIYRSLTLWSKIGDATEEMDEFAAASCLAEEIRNFELLYAGIIGVHKKGSIVYYDIETLGMSIRGPIGGHYSRYAENNAVIVILSIHLHLYLIRKVIFCDFYDTDTTFQNVKLYTLTENCLYHANLNDEIFITRFSGPKLEATFIQKSDDGIMSMGFSHGKLNVLTFERKIYSVIDNKLVFQCTLGPDSNLLHQLHHYNFLEQLDWRVYFQWMYVLNHTIPDGPLRDIITIRPYGDVYFVGSNWGVLRIYYSPYSEGEFDIFNTEPVKQYNFMERSDCPVLSTCPILQVDVLEGKDQHKVIVAMPKKIAILTFKHTFKQASSLAVVPHYDHRMIQSLNRL
ncbi:unnamed protein product [Chrysodeixis includens]|uniref:F-box domain-containing protein n=1 Tax=Chrysodeixis includens TaxID=689277 RepID=A0A9P0BY06_CHRIL|nr:unnamed protein product [Chrysodeixis includens]